MSVDDQILASNIAISPCSYTSPYPDGDHILGLVQYGIAARRPATGEGQGVQYPVPRSLNLVNTSTTSLASRNAHWTGDGISPIGQHVKAASKQKKNGPPGMIQE
jgi:hypothetical protein